MANVNRYTQLQNTVYQPRSLQELMMVPAYKRQKHDEINSSIAEYETLLSQKQGLDLHDPVLKAEQDKLYQKMIQQRDRLEAEGFSPSSKSDFIRFNKEYQQSIGPGGQIGKIEAARKAYEANKAASIANLVKQGYTPESAAANWEDFSKEYETGYEEGKITNIGELYGSKFRDPVSEAHVVMQNAGFDAQTILNDLGTGVIKRDPLTGAMHVETTKAYEKYKDNAKNLQNVVDYYNRQILNPESEIGKSLKIQRRDPNQVMDEILGLDKIYSQTEKDFGSGKTLSNFDFNRAAINAKVAGETKEGVSTIINVENSYLPHEFANNTYVDNKNLLKELSSIPEDKLKPEEKVKLNQLKKFQTKVEETLNSNEDYLKLQTALDTKLTNLNLEPELIEKLKEVNFDIAYASSTKRGRSNEYQLRIGDDNPITINKDQKNKIDNFIENIEPIKNQINNIRSQSTKENIIKTSGYSLLPGTAKESKDYDRMNTNVENSLKFNSSNLQNNFNIESVDLPNGSRTKLSSDDLDIISQVFNNTKPGSLRLLGNITEGYSGKPELIVEVQTEEGNSGDLNQILRNDEGSGEIGNGKPLRLKLSFKDDHGDTLNNINGYVLDYFENKGQIDPRTNRPVGYDLAMSQRKHMFNNSTWKEALNKNYSPKSTNILYSRIIDIAEQDLIKNGSSSIYKGIKSEQELVNKFIEENGDNFITFED